MVTTVSRGMERRADFPRPTRSSMIESERLGWPTLLAPCSSDPDARASEPSTRIVEGDSATLPPVVERVARRVGDLAALNLRADQEEHQREREPGGDEPREPTGAPAAR